MDSKLKIKLQIFEARNLKRNSLFNLPNVFAKISVNNSLESFKTETVKSSKNPKWNESFNISLNREDLIYISLWDVSEGNCLCIKSNTNWNRKFLGFTMISYSMAEERQNEGRFRVKIDNYKKNNHSKNKGYLYISIQPSSNLTNSVELLSMPTNLNDSVIADNEEPVVSCFNFGKFSKRRTQSLNSYDRRLSGEDQLLLRSESESTRNISSSNTLDDISDSLSIDSNESPKTRQFNQKYNNFKMSLADIQLNANILRLEINREHLLEESYCFLSKVGASYLKNNIQIKFADEEGIDSGGISKEWFNLLTKKVFDPMFGLFEYNQQEHKLEINKNASITTPKLSDDYKFIGALFGFSLRYGYVIDSYFVKPFMKLLLGKEVNLDDLKFVDKELFNSLTWILENNIDEVSLFNKFTIEHEIFGEKIQIELIENGENIPLNESNKHEYVRLYANWRLKESVKKQMECIMSGLNNVFPDFLLNEFDEDELELLLFGTNTIDICEWKKHTKYVGCDEDDTCVEWFWTIVEKMSSETRVKLLELVTGSSRLPLHGFKDLELAGTHPFTFCVSQILDNSSLPTMQTCFNRIIIPEYSSYETFKRKLLLTIQETCTFSLK